MKKIFNGREVTIMTCSDCNTKCKHCYISYNGNFEPNELLNLCRCLKKSYRVLLNGTEILLHPEYFDAIKLINQNFLLTNGLELSRNPKIIKKLNNIGIENIGMSFHIGIHEEISQVKEEIIKSNISKLLEYGINTDIRTTITKHNYMFIEEMCRKAKMLGASGIKFTNYMHMGNALALDEENILSDNEIKVFFDLLEETRKKYSRDELLIRRCGSFGNNARNCKFRCTAGIESVVITPELKVYPCFFLAKKGMEIGYVDDGKVIITKEITNNGELCLAKEVNNNNYKL